ncbi:4-(cytidine 5'-diphospho)-2-C-methyl-D-erythritol kinase [Enterovirga aerilata]|uniref:4-diphosphocytidyl-2-C-methyl-D-erythritol kinase n=1 Tax=Enterovirga aerilata TaxID=2730920 RepID=A0A849IF23_9HYPH|nr:4-(cytidine 5'-diphospho)-2-C-methyl-D-erythritol kinase [Enterovirga sp. DB1703]NNM74567.1 4-(cytidine 5'-diphospho)-2-C-methyl-D-erythritol kinase [Enterovirga sp. DB1703]
MPSGVLATRAPAKVNLTLHVLGRRPDGYHELESLVVFAGAADRLELEPGDGLSLRIEGPTAAAAGPADDNLVLRAARHLAERVAFLRMGTFRLTKNLPAAAGIGGGSSDAAAALRLLASLNGLPADDPRLFDAARRTGADVPVCLDPRARMMRGVGERIGPPLDLPPLFAVMVNPRVSVPTPEVFRRLGRVPGDLGPPDHPAVPGRISAGDLVSLLVAGGRNDLEPPAIAAEPVIGTALSRLRALDGCRLARMSGSGATVFGLFDDCRAASRAARALRVAEPSWWVKATVFR